MQDFVRIGGEIVSAPLNENFRRLMNAISIANTNLLFPEQYGTVNTIDDMNAIPEPLDAQTCYVISSGELYRYTKTGGGRWVKIADFGQTFRQGFLNSGAVVVAAPMTKEGANTIAMPDMLLYYKNKEGDGRYLKGMYAVDATTLDASAFTTPGVYSIYATMQNLEAPSYIINAGIPTEDEVEKIYLGSFLVDSTTEILDDFVFTIPDIAYTGDRGYFYVSGGDANGLNLMPGATHDNKVNRKEGGYYDEGVNYATGPIANFPANVDNGSNYNLKFFASQSSVDKIYYMSPESALQQPVSFTNGLIKNKYWNTSTHSLDDVETGYFTIQQHFVTPNGQNVILYGTKTYNSMLDAISNINFVYGADINFPYVEATRIVIGNCANFDTGNSDHVRFLTMGRLAQVGTISPEFADNQFILYSGTTLDTTPSAIQIKLDALQQEDYDIDHLGYYRLRVLPYGTTRKLFSLANQYITDSSTPSVTQTAADQRRYPDPGYFIADTKDIDYLEQRVSNIENEIWALYDSTKARYEQSIRKRLYDAENRLDADDVTLADHTARITSLEQNKVNKGTTVNGYTLGDTTTANETKQVVLYTGDITEGSGRNQSANLWYTDARVNANTRVSTAYTHATTQSLTDDADDHIKVNPHNLSTDDINILLDTTKIFVTPEEERRIRADRLPDNTIQALADLDAKNLDYIPITKLGGSRDVPTGTRTLLGNFKALEFFEDGVDFDTSVDGNTLTLNIRGQIDENTVMLKNRYATLEAEYPSLYGGYVDNAVNAEYANHVHGIEDAQPNQYYGTDNLGGVGIYDLPTYVGTVNQSSFASLDQIIFVPVDGSVTENHLTTSLKDKINNNYHTVYNGGTLSSNEINTFTFGNNLDVTVNGHAVTINATGGSGTGVSEFANLNDVDVVYTDNAGKVLVVNEDEDGVTLASFPALTDYMRKSVYVSQTDITKVKKAELADSATIAINATNASAVNSKIVDDTDNTVGSLWTAAKIISNTSSQISLEGVNTYSGTTTPLNTLGKNGDLYILIES